MEENNNKKMKYDEKSALYGGISSICLCIIAIAMIALKYGSHYIWLTFLLIVFSNIKAIRVTLDKMKKEGKKTILLFSGFCCIFTILVFGVIFYIR